MSEDKESPIEGMVLVEHPDKELRLKIRNAGYVRDEDGRYLIGGKWQTLSQAVAREKRIKNLKPFEKGNRMGELNRKEELSPKETLEVLMRMRIDGSDITGLEGKFTVQEMVMTRLIEMSLNGSIAAIRELMDRTVGKAVPATEKIQDHVFEEKSLADMVNFVSNKQIEEGKKDD